MVFGKLKTSSNANSPGYAFSQVGTAQQSSAAIRQEEADIIYNPLPAPAASALASSPVHLSSHSPASSASSSSSLSSPQRGNGYKEVNIDSRSSSPSPLNPSFNSNNSPLLAGSPTFAFTNRFNMPSENPSRAYSTSTTSGRGNSGMPDRGDSSNALLGNRAGRPSASRRYGPTAASPTIDHNAPLLGGAAAGVGAGGGSSAGARQNTWGQDAIGVDNGFDGKEEADDWLHNPTPGDRKGDGRGSIFTSRGAANIGCLALLGVGIVTLFAGYPIISFYTSGSLDSRGGYNLGGINSTGQIPLIPGFTTVLDSDTPQEAYTRTGFDGEQYTLVFSDEFNKDGRTFFPGDDPYWTAMDFHYWPTGDFEWYDPSAATTKGGNLVLTMTQEPIHDLNFKSAMMQSWNQLCFQYSFYMEARISLPGTNTVGGFWPGVWLMGNLGRPGYGASTEGTWPYTYDSCDIGTLANQTNVGGTGPEEALTSNNDGPVSFLPGQRVSACTCKGEDHPGPDVSYGRAAPEIDIIEAQIDLSRPRGQVSQSFQVAPFDNGYQYLNTSKGAIQYDTDLTIWNSYKGGQYQEAVSSLTYIDNSLYQGTSGQFGVHGVEMFADPNNREKGHITWVADGVKSWTMYPPAIGPSTTMGIGQRLIPEEPMAMVINFGMSNNFQAVNFDQLVWPAEMHIDYVRVYQRSEGRMGCDPADRPTADYIARHANAYNNPNLTTWAAAGYDVPKNSLRDTC